ncbi:uncharacterized protein O3C94_000386 [Discoglossus pictus]
MFSRRGSLTWERWGYFLTALICSQFPMSWSQVFITLQPPMPTVGQNVLLSVTTNDEILMINWFKGSDTGSNMNILTYNPVRRVPPTHGKMYTGRETVVDNGSLLISNLITNDSGFYTVQLTTAINAIVATTELTVLPANGGGNTAILVTPVTPGSTVPPLNQPAPNGGGSTLIPITPVIPGSAVPPLNQPGDTGTGKSIGAVVGAAIGGVAAVGLFVTALVMWFKRRSRRTKQESDFESEKPTTGQASKENREYTYPDPRRLPSIPPVHIPPDTQITTPDNEHPYMELTYPYEVLYKDLQGTK